MKIEITNVKKVKLNKGDTLFFELTKELPKHQIEKYFNALQEFFNDQIVVVLPKGVTLKEIGHKKEIK